ncbi:MAG TPA: arsenate reductase ArsC [Aggregatilineales bacterium]|nr:arsenate reductase ArsC [Anaerolineales bacterium]HRE47796.1 arsenate reductase ArsC [Aggregatilineales bacterium]
METVLILCTGNAARSQMAEGFLWALAGDRFVVHSAGSKPSIVNSLAIQVMAERGIDLSQHRSKHWEEFRSQPIKYVITVCDAAAESCPLFPGKTQRLHWSFPDPAAVQGADEVRLHAFRTVRDAHSRSPARMAGEPVDSAH